MEMIPKLQKKKKKKREGKDWTVSMFKNVNVINVILKNGRPDLK